LKIRQLDNAAMTIIEQLLKINWIGLKCRSGHTASPAL